MSGGSLVMYGQLAVVAAHHEVTLATFAGADAADWDAIETLRGSGIPVHYVWRSCPRGIELWQRRMRDGVSWLDGTRPLRTLQFFEPKMQQLLDRLLSEQHFDLIQVEDNAMGNYRYPTPSAKLFTEHEARTFQPADSGSLLKSKWLHGALNKAESRRWQAYQPAVWRKFERIQVFTPRDATVIRDMVPAIAERVRVNPFGIDIPKVADLDCELPGNVVFTAGFGHLPNVDAAVWLAKEIMPLLRVRRPGVQLFIVGNNPPKKVQALATDDITVTGRVPAVEPFLQRAAVVIAPLRSGGGMRVKVLQAMAMAKAVITTAVGAEGLAVEGCQLPVVIANDAEEIADSTAKLLVAEDQRRTLGHCARAYVREHFSWSAYGRRLEEIYTELQRMGSVKCCNGMPS
jgi:glycosyltransferase involved in cell wall biosynthesis